MRALASGRLLTFAALAMIGCSLDLWTKHWIFHRLDYNDPFHTPWWLIDGVFGFQLSLNRGALFGIGQGQVWIFATLSIAAFAGIVYWMVRHSGRAPWLLSIALGLILGGVGGNLYDRLGLWSHPSIAAADRHAVRDWILFRVGEWSWPNFNIADSLLVVGALLLVCSSMASPDEAKPAS